MLPALEREVDIPVSKDKHAVPMIKDRDERHR